jgi:hypothetical protein
MKTKRLAGSKHDVLSLAARINFFYRFFNQRNWARCYEYVDPKLSAKTKSGLSDYSQTMRDFFEAHGPIAQVKILKISIHSGIEAKNDQRDFAYVVISWIDKSNELYHFRERWIKDREKWFTRVIGLVPNRSEP